MSLQVVAPADGDEAATEIERGGLLGGGHD